MDMISKLIREVDGVRHFCGNENLKEDFNITVTLAKACSQYIIDLDEEVNWDNEITCYNCRYRRWTNLGYSCYKNFPVDEKLIKGED